MYTAILLAVCASIQLHVVNADLGSVPCFAGVNGYDIGVHQLHSTAQCWQEGHFGKACAITGVDADCDEVFQEVLQENLPATFNLLERARLKRALKQPGE